MSKDIESPQVKCKLIEENQKNRQVKISLEISNIHNSCIDLCKNCDLETTIPKHRADKPINTVVDFELTEEGKEFFEKEAQIAEDVRKIVGEQEKRLAALLYLICVEKKIKPSDLMLCIEHPRIVDGQTVVKMYFKKREEIK